MTPDFPSIKKERETSREAQIRAAGRMVGIAGLVLATWLVWRHHPEATLHLLMAAGWGVLTIAPVHLLPMAVNAWDWRTLVERAGRPSFPAMLKLVWIRESINGLLPVARVGGEIASFQHLARLGVSSSSATSSLIVDTQLTLISQILYASAAIAWIFQRATSATSHLLGQLAWITLVFAVLSLLFVLVHHVKPFERIANCLNTLTSGKLLALLGPSRRIDDSVKQLWQQRGVVVRYLFVWQTVQFAGFALEIYVALYVLAQPVSFAEAAAIEALIQLVSSAAFFVPGALGVQEGAFVIIGSIFGLDASVCLALAGTRRVRDLVIYLPGLLVWQLAD